MHDSIDFILKYVYNKPNKATYIVTHLTDLHYCTACYQGSADKLIIIHYQGQQHNFMSLS